MSSFVPSSAYDLFVLSLLFGPVPALWAYCKVEIWWKKRRGVAPGCALAPAELDERDANILEIASSVLRHFKRVNLADSVGDIAKRLKATSHNHGVKS